MRKIEKILIERKTGKKFLVKDLSEDFHTSFGVISSFDEEIVFSNKGNEFLVLEPQFSDLWEELKRGPQVMIQKDIGLILAKTGVNRRSKVVDAGGGSGSLCLSLANICDHITVYEINPEHHDIVARNIRNFGFDNIELKQGNVYESISEKDIDLVTLDLSEPWKVDLKGVLKVGGHLVVYLPNLGQVKRFIENLKGIKLIEVIELIERKWKITDKIMRPEFEMLGHTGFLVFCRKL